MLRRWLRLLGCILALNTGLTLAAALPGRLTPPTPLLRFLATTEAEDDCTTRTGFICKRLYILDSTGKIASGALDAPVRGYTLWSPDAARLAVVTYDYDDLLRNHLTIVDTAGQTLFDAQIAFWLGHPLDAPGWQWSPDGQTLVMQFSDGISQSDIALLDVTSGHLTVIDTRTGFDERPVWSPDGRRIAFHGAQRGRSDMFVMDASGANTRLPFGHPAWTASFWPAWLPDSRRIVFFASRRSRPDAPLANGLYVGDIESGGIAALTADHLDVHTAAIAPIGAYLAFAAYEASHQRRAYIAHADTLTVYPVTGLTDTSPTDIAWSPDGRRFSARFGAAVYVVDAVSGSASYLMPAPYGFALPRWSPDGRWLAHLADEPACFSRSCANLNLVDVRRALRVTVTPPALSVGSYTWIP